MPPPLPRSHQLSVPREDFPSSTPQIPQPPTPLLCYWTNTGSHQAKHSEHTNPHLSSAKPAVGSRGPTWHQVNQAPGDPWACCCLRDWSAFSPSSLSQTLSLWASISGALFTAWPLLQKPCWDINLPFSWVCCILDPLINAGLSYPLSFLIDEQEFSLITACVILHSVITFYLVSITPGLSTIQLVLSDLLILLCWCCLPALPSASFTHTSIFLCQSH